MRKWQKKSLMVLAVVAGITLWICLSVSSITRLKDKYKGYEATEKIWVPENYTIVNQIDGKYVPVRDVRLSGTAVYVLFKDFKESFANRDTDVIIETDGLVHYIIEEGKRKFFTKKEHTPYEPFRSHRCEIAIADLTVKNFYGPRGIVEESIGRVLFWGIGIGALCFICYLGYKAIKAIKAIKAMRRKPA